MQPLGRSLRRSGARLPVMLSLLVLAAACGRGSDDRGAGRGDDELGGGDLPGYDLVVEQDLGDGSPPQRWRLGCKRSDRGDHPFAEQACAHLLGLDDPFAPLPDDRMCAQVYGGPQTARITGIWQASPVDLSLARTDGCLIEQWDRLGPVLPGPVG